jgi:hypothetical protein
VAQTSHTLFVAPIGCGADLTHFVCRTNRLWRRPHTLVCRTNRLWRRPHTLVCRTNRLLRRPHTLVCRTNRRIRVAERVTERVTERVGPKFNVHGLRSSHDIVPASIGDGVRNRYHIICIITRAGVHVKLSCAHASFY